MKMQLLNRLDPCGRLLYSLFYILWSVLSPAYGIEIDNGVTGSTVVCNADAITVNFETRNPFSGRIFIKGMSENGECVKSWSQSAARTTSPSIEFAFGACNMQRARTLSPARGMMQSVVVVISFHSMFLTKVDRAFKVQCFYMEAEKAVTSNLEVSMLTTDSLRDAAAMPSCSYTVRQGSRSGPPIRFARIGEPVYHEWQCESATHDLLVKSCFVDDGQGNRYEIIDDRGCAMDPVVMPDLTYEQASGSAGNAVAWVEAHVFKFADRPNVFFQCVVQLCNRGEPDCTAITPPKCSRRVSRQRRRAAVGNSTISTAADSTTSANEMDLIANPIKVLDLEDSVQNRRQQSSQGDDAGRLPAGGWVPGILFQNGGSPFDADFEPAEVAVCMSPASFGTLLAMILLVLLVGLIVSVLLCIGRLRLVHIIKQQHH